MLYGGQSYKALQPWNAFYCRLILTLWQSPISHWIVWGGACVCVSVREFTRSHSPGPWLIEQICTAGVEAHALQEIWFMSTEAGAHIYWQRWHICANNWIYSIYYMHTYFFQIIKDTLTSKNILVLDSKKVQSPLDCLPEIKKRNSQKVGTLSKLQQKLKSVIWSFTSTVINMANEQRFSGSTPNKFTPGSLSRLSYFVQSEA